MSFFEHYLPMGKNQAQKIIVRLFFSRILASTIFLIENAEGS